MRLLLGVEGEVVPPGGVQTFNSVAHDPSRTSYYGPTVLLKPQGVVEAVEGGVHTSLNSWHTPIQGDARLRLVHGCELLCIWNN